MLSITPITNYHTFKAKPQKASDDTKVKKDKQMQNTLGTIAVISGILLGGAATYVIAKNASIMTFEQALKKQGISLKNGKAILESTGEKFTGTIKRNEGINRKEVVNFLDGNITEKLYYNALGKELDGIFYKNGKPALRVGGRSGNTNTYFAYTDLETFEKGDCYIEGEKKSVFECARDFMKKKAS